MTRALVLGATGTVGRRVARQLGERGVDVAAASRAPADSGQVRFGWAAPGTWEAAVDGVTHAFVMAPDGVPVDPRFLRLAADRGVARMVLLSSKAIEAMGDQRLFAAERTVRDAGAAWTIVRADWFDQNFDEGVLRDAVLAGEVALPLGDVRQAFVDAEDLAVVAVTALTEPSHEGRTYELGGPETLSFAEAVGIVAEAAGRPVRYLGDDGDYVRVMTGLGVDRAQALAEAGAFAALRAAGDAHVDDTVEHVTGRPPRDLRTYAREAAARGACR